MSFWVVGAKGYPQQLLGGRLRSFFSELQTLPNFLHSLVWIGQNGGHPQRKGTSFGVFVRKYGWTLPRCEGTNFEALICITSTWSPSPFGFVWSSLMFNISLVRGQGNGGGVSGLAEGGGCQGSLLEIEGRGGGAHSGQEGVPGKSNYCIFLQA